MKNLMLLTRHISLTLFVVLFSTVVTSAQTTRFAFQGRLPSDFNPATAPYDLQFNLYDELSGTNSPLNATPIIVEDVQVTNGAFTVVLDFGSLFSGEDRYLEIGARAGNSTGAFTIVNPRQEIASAPYAIRSLSSVTAESATNAENLGGTPSNNFVLTTDSRLTDARTPIAGSNNYIQNTTGVQTGANFNIDGDGTASIFNAMTQFNIGGNRVLSIAGTRNVFAGIGAGAANTAGTESSFYGFEAGNKNSVGNLNSFFGMQAGAGNIQGNGNSFFGHQAGFNSTGSLNVFVGKNAGNSNQGGANTFVGYASGFNNSTGTLNSFLGFEAGFNTTTGTANTFLGDFAGNDNTTGSHNTMIGAETNIVFGSNPSYATTIGSRSVVGTSDTIVLGKLAGIYDGVSRPADTVQIPGNLNVAGTVSGTINGTNITNLNASNITTGTLNNARLGVIPTANIADSAINTAKIADSAVTAAKIGNNQVVKNLNGLTDNVNLVAGANVTITPAGNTLTIASAGSPWSTNGSNVFYNLGNVGIGTDTPDVSLRVHHSSSNINTNNVQLPDLGLALRNTSNTNGNMTLISFQDASGFGNAQIGAVQSNQLNHSAELVFFTRNAGASGERLRIKSDGIVVLNTLGTAGGSTLCRNASNQIANCSSSLRYKTNVTPFSTGLGLLKRLRPITFEWKDGRMRDVGFGAEEVAAVEPLLVTYNANGEVEGVKYDRISAVLVNAVKEQEKQIQEQQKLLQQQRADLDSQQRQLDQQRVLIDTLTKLLCEDKPNLRICRL